jgi:SAM-dependent methyltransferase
MPTLSEAVTWHDVECGDYAADLPLWAELAAASAGPVLELGCGTGRVALHLARQGFEVTGVDKDAELVESMRRRAADECLAVAAEAVDVELLDLEQRFALIVAPMQLIQVLPGEAACRRCLQRVAAHLLPGGVAAIAIVEELAAGTPPSPLLPDVREREGWVYSSLPLGARLDEGMLTVERLRQTVDPDGRLRETRNEVSLRGLSATRLEEEGREAGLRPGGRRRIAATEAHVGSTVVLLEAA